MNTLTIPDSTSTTHPLQGGPTMSSNPITNSQQPIDDLAGKLKRTVLQHSEVLVDRETAEIADVLVNHLAATFSHQKETTQCLEERFEALGLPVSIKVFDKIVVCISGSFTTRPVC